MATSSSSPSPVGTLEFLPEVDIAAGEEFVPFGAGLGGAVSPAESTRPEVGLLSLEERLRAHARQEAEAALEGRMEELRREQDQRLRTLGEQLGGELRTRISEVSAIAVELALAMAERIVRREIQEDADALVRVVRDVLWKLPEAREMKLRVHPDDAEALEGRPEILAELRVKSLLPDRRITRGGCVVEVGEESWDATVEGQLEQLRAALGPLAESDA